MSSAFDTIDREYLQPTNSDKDVIRMIRVLISKTALEIKLQNDKISSFVSKAHHKEVVFCLTYAFNLYKIHWDL